MPVQYIRQRRNRRVSRNVPRHLREFVAQGQAQLKFQIIAHSVVVLLQAACLALPRVLAARHNFACGEPTWRISRTLSAMASSASSGRMVPRSGSESVRCAYGRPPGPFAGLKPSTRNADYFHSLCSFLRLRVDPCQIPKLIKPYWGPVGGWGSARAISEILLREGISGPRCPHAATSKQAVRLCLRQLLLRQTRASTSL